MGRSGCTLKPVDTAAALTSGSTTRPRLPQPRASALPLLLGSGPSPFEATRQPSSGRPETEDLRSKPLTGTTSCWACGCGSSPPRSSSWCGMAPSSRPGPWGARCGRRARATRPLATRRARPPSTYYETLTLALTPALTLSLTLTPTLPLPLPLTLSLSLPLNQSSMAEIAKRVGLPSGAKWAFAAPSPATADASAASEKFAAPLKGDAAALAALQALGSPDTDPPPHPPPSHPHPSVWSKPPWEHMHPLTVLRP